MVHYALIYVLFGSLVTGLNVIQCNDGVRDCDFLDESSSMTCAINNKEYPSPKTQGAIMGISTIVALLMAVGIGANDSANS